MIAEEGIRGEGRRKGEGGKEEESKRIRKEM